MGLKKKVRSLFKTKKTEPALQHAEQSPADRASTYISPDYLKTEEWFWPLKNAIHADVDNTVSGALWKKIPGGHKWLNYFEAYDEVFGMFRDMPVKVLEIGVDRGGSIKLWREFFGSDMTFVGIDINPQCQKYENAANKNHVRIGSQDDISFLKKVIDEFGKFNIIIDDGSHIVSHQIASFNALFDYGLADDGIYFVEDLETSYWGRKTEQYDLDISFIDFAKSVIDIMHAPYVNHLYPDFVLENSIEKSITVPRLCKLVNQVRFYDSITVFFKKARTPPVVEWRPE